MKRKAQSFTFCRCGVPYEFACKCPEDVLERFSAQLPLGQRIFYIGDFIAWMDKEFGEVEKDFGVSLEELINTVLNLDGVEEIGDSAYKTPFE